MPAATILGSRHSLLPSESSSLAERVCHSCILWDAGAPGKEVSGRSQVKEDTVESSPRAGPSWCNTVRTPSDVHHRQDAVGHQAP